MPYHLAIDVGTTWTAAALARDGRVETAQLGTRRQAVPSVVYLADDRLLVGEPAARRAVSDPRRVAREFKRRVGDPTPLLLGGTPVSAELCMARVASWVTDQVAAAEGAPPATLTLTHPASWGEFKLDLLRQALRHVGRPVDHLVPEPVAAATAYAAERPLEPDSVVAVYDLGGGTFDAAVVRAGGPGDRAAILGRPDGIERLGGIDFDHAVFEHVAGSLHLDLDPRPHDASLASGMARLREACVEAKEALSEDTHVSIPVMLPQVHTEVLLTRREFEAMISPALDETIVALQRAIGSAGVRDDQVAAVLLVGGSSRIPLVGQLVAMRLRRPVAVDARPKDAVCLGAAHLALAAAGTRAAPAVVAPPNVSSTDGVSAAGHEAAPPGVPVVSRLDTDDDRSLRVRRGVAAGLAAVILVAAAVGGTLLLVDGSDGGGEAATTTTSSEPNGRPETTERPSTTSGSGVATDDIEPLPGNDWNDEARTRFISDCTTHLSDELSLAGTDPADGCGCMYDEAESDPEWTFDSFDAAWSADELADVDEADLQRLSSLILECGRIGG